MSLTLEINTVTGRQFTDWLSEKAPKTKVGDTYSADNNPIANFYRQAMGVDAEVGDNMKYIDVHARVRGADILVRQNLPRWATNFLREVSALDQETVSATRALSVFEAVYGTLR